MMSIEYENKVKNYLRMLEKEARNITATPEGSSFYIHLVTTTNLISESLF